MTVLKGRNAGTYSALKTALPPAHRHCRVFAAWLMQATTHGARLGSRRARLLLGQRVTIGCLAVALAFNTATPFTLGGMTPFLDDGRIEIDAVEPHAPVLNVP